jgi:tryptophan synthase alpha chain
MGRIERSLREAAGRHEKALSLFVTAGYPTLQSTREILGVLEEGGADLVELGMPFSDPLADGPVIQESSMVALKNGVTLEGILGDVAAFRRSSDLPIVLMGYLNPILRYGAERFFAAAADAGVDGLILPELPLGEGEAYRAMIRSRGIADILLVAPTTADDRIRDIDLASEGFLYCVSATGVTGLAGRIPAERYLRNVKGQAAKNPVLVGFGISTPADARAFGEPVDGIVVGSALLRRLAGGASFEAIAQWVGELKSALR